MGKLMCVFPKLSQHFANNPTQTAGEKLPSLHVGLQQSHWISWDPTCEAGPGHSHGRGWGQFGLCGPLWSRGLWIADHGKELRRPLSPFSFPPTSEAGRWQAKFPSRVGTMFRTQQIIINSKHDTWVPSPSVANDLPSLVLVTTWTTLPHLQHAPRPTPAPKATQVSCRFPPLIQARSFPLLIIVSVHTTSSRRQFRWWV